MDPAPRASAAVPTAPPTDLGAAALHQVVAALALLSAGELADLVGGRGRLVYQSTPEPGRDPGQAPLVASTPIRARHPATVRRRRSAAPSGVAVTDAVAAIRLLATPGEVADYLQRHDASFTIPVLREVARALGPTVSATARSKADLRRNIIEGTAGYRVRSASMSGGAWS